MKIDLNAYIKGIEKMMIYSQTDENGVITNVNRHFCRVSGYSKKELIGKKHGILKHPDISKCAFRKLRKKMGDTKPYKIIFQNLSKDGKTLYLDTLIIPILNEKAEICAYASLSYDISKFFELNGELLNAKNELRQMNENFEEVMINYHKSFYEQRQSVEEELRSNFINNEAELRQIHQKSVDISVQQTLVNLAHQWRQPLNELGIALFELKNNAHNSDALQANYDKCKDLIQKMSSSIDSFTNSLSKQRLSCFWLKNALKEVLDINFEAFENAGANIEIQSKESDYLVFGAKDELVRVFYHLFMNAIEAYGKKKNKNIFVTLSKFNKNYVKISVKDKAGGILFLDKVFQPFWTTKYPVQGAGLDLYFCKQIVESMQGQIVASNDKKGACFNIYLKECKENQ